MTFTSEQLKSMSPVAYAKAKNAEVNARAAAEGWTLFLLIPEDPEFHEGCGHKTAYDYVLASAKQELSDVFKEVNGFRPRGIYDFGEMDLEAVDAEIAKIVDRMNAQAEMDEMRERMDDLDNHCREKKEAERAACWDHNHDDRGAEPLTHNPFAILGSK